MVGESENLFRSGHPRSLWQHSEFLKLWAGQTISTIGSGVTASALPLTAVLVLGAHASDMGWLLAVESAPVLLVGMFAGVWVDRLPRRRLLIGADLGRAGLLACIPLLAYLGGLRIEHLYAVALTTGALTVLFDIAYRSFVPELASRALLPTRSCPLLWATPHATGSCRWNCAGRGMGGALRLVAGTLIATACAMRSNCGRSPYA